MLKVEVQEWTLHARCKGLASHPGWGDVMFPSARQRRDIAAAKRICSGCPVAQQCIADGRNDRHSVRGGLTADERRRLYDGELVTLCPTCTLPFVARPSNPTECTGCARQEITTDDYKDEILDLHAKGWAAEHIAIHLGFSRDDIRIAGERWKVRLGRRSVADCGTSAGAARHRRHHEPVCSPCRNADSRQAMARKNKAA